MRHGTTNGTTSPADVRKPTVPLTRPWAAPAREEVHTLLAALANDVCAFLEKRSTWIDEDRMRLVGRERTSPARHIVTGADRLEFRSSAVRDKLQTRLSTTAPVAADIQGDAMKSTAQHSGVPQF